MVLMLSSRDFEQRQEIRILFDTPRGLDVAPAVDEEYSSLRVQ
jgi:hypothetical protein